MRQSQNKTVLCGLSYQRRERLGFQISERASYQGTCTNAQRSVGKTPAIYSSSPWFCQPEREGGRILRFPTMTLGFYLHVGPWAIAEGRALDPESDDLLLRSSSASYQPGGPGKVTSRGRERLCVYAKPLSAPRAHTLRLYFPGALWWVRPRG